MSLIEDFLSSLLDEFLGLVELRISFINLHVQDGVRVNRLLLPIVGLSLNTNLVEVHLFLARWRLLFFGLLL